MLYTISFQALIPEYYPLGVCLVNVWFVESWVLEVVDEVSEVQAFGIDALVVGNVGDARHTALLL